MSGFFSKVCLEYVWIDGNNELRSKIKLMPHNQLFPKVSPATVSEGVTMLANNPLWRQLSHNFYPSSSNIVLPKLVNIPVWNFDGSSTGQATGHESDVILRPVHIYENPFYSDTKIHGEPMLAYIVLCECYNKDYTTHATNTRVACSLSAEKFALSECLFGIEQEYVLFERLRPNIGGDNDYVMFDEIITPENAPSKTCLPYKWISRNDPGKGPQGPYYCSAGGDRSFGRVIADEHMLLCLKAGIEICGTNSEVMASQWEFQVGACDPLKTCDDLIVARYILNKVTEKYNCWASFHPKPYKGDWNGSGAHTNFSTKEMRAPGGFKYVLEACEKMRATHTEHIQIYGIDNELRLTGAHETAAITEYNWGVGNRGCSVRIPLHVFNNGCGYLEDRRPASNCDPYLVTNAIMKTICGNNE